MWTLVACRLRRRSERKVAAGDMTGLGDVDEEEVDEDDLIGVSTFRAGSWRDAARSLRTKEGRARCYDNNLRGSRAYLAAAWAMDPNRPTRNEDEEEDDGVEAIPMSELAAMGEVRPQRNKTFRSLKIVAKAGRTRRACGQIEGEPAASGGSGGGSSNASSSQSSAQGRRANG